VRRITVIMVIVLGLSVVPSAFAVGGSVLDAYGGQGSAKVVKVKGATATTTAAPANTTTGSLPFTGSDLVWSMVAGSALLVVGVGLRKLGRNES